MVRSLADARTNERDGVHSRQADPLATNPRQAKDPRPTAQRRLS